MLFEWDDNKEKINIAKHGIDFSTAAHVFQDENRIELSDSYGMVIGTIDADQLNNCEIINYDGDGAIIDLGDLSDY